jgi:exonuclease III
MTGTKRNPLILTLNVKGFNGQMKRHKISNSVKKQDPTIRCLQETHLTEKVKHWLRFKGWKKNFQVNGSHKQAGIALFISDKVDFRLKSTRRDKKGHFTLTKGAIHQADIPIFSIYTPILHEKNYNDSKSIDNANTVIVGDLNTPLSPISIDRSSRQKSTKKLQNYSTH